MTWRLLRDGPGRAAWNMAVDEALLEHCAARGPALRLYTWSLPTLSLGYRQAPPADLPRARDGELERVRRITGGGAVLHAGDLTYAVVAPWASAALPEGLLGSYHWIRDALLDALASLGLDVRPARGCEAADRLAICFAGATGLEIELAGVKLVGSAQRRTPFGLLQHGSIRLRDDSELYANLLGAHVSAPPAELAGCDASTVADALVRAFAARLAGPFQEAELSPCERVTAQVRAQARAADALARPRTASRWVPPGR